MYGSFEDSNRYIKCWNCGFIIDTNRLSAGDGSGIVVEDFDFEPDRYVSDYEKYWHGLESDLTGVNYDITMDTPCSAGCILLNGPDGNVVTSFYTPRTAKAGSGCPFCGTRNLP